MPEYTFKDFCTQIFFSLAFGLFYVILVQFLFMVLDKGPGPTDGAGILGGVIGLTTSPLAIIGAAVLYPYPVFTRIIKICAYFGLFFLSIVLTLLCCNLSTG
jgi:hypothetical protein